MMLLFSVCSPLKHFPVSLWLTLYSTSIWSQYLLCSSPALTYSLIKCSLLFGVTTLFLTPHRLWLVSLPKGWETIITLIIRWAEEGTDIKAAEKGAGASRDTDTALPPPSSSSFIAAVQCHAQPIAPDRRLLPHFPQQWGFCLALCLKAVVTLPCQDATQHLCARGASCTTPSGRYTASAGLHLTG